MNEKNHLDHQLIKLAFQHSSDAVALITVEETTFSYEYLNPVAQSIVGFNENIYGKRFEDIYTEQELDLRYPLFRQVVMSCLEVIQDNIYTLISGAVIEKIAITPICVSGKCTHLLVVAKDITELEKQADQITMTGNLVDSILQSTADAIVIGDRHGMIIRTNEKFKEIFGWDEDDLKGTQFGDGPIIPTDRKHEGMKLFSDIKEGKQIRSFRTKRLTKSGESIDVSINYFPIFNGKGDIVGVTAFLRDIRQDLMTKQALKEYEKLLKEMAFNDSLTGLPNRRMLEERFQHELSRAKQNQGKFAVLFLDMDGFKEVNDTLGHDIGDDIIVQFSNLIRGCLRDSDTMARLGGDEFVILLPDIHSLEDIRVIAERMITSANQPIKINGQTVEVSTSIGVSIYPKHGDDLKTLLKLADNALYQAKSAGKNCLYFNS